MLQVFGGMSDDSPSAVQGVTSLLDTKRFWENQEYAQTNNNTGVSM